MKTSEELVEEFAVNVMLQTDAIRTGNHKLGNRCAKRYIEAFRFLRNRGDDGYLALLPLMRHSRDDVRAMAAAFLLRFETNEALKVLNEIASGNGIIAFTASETIKRWEEGTWALD